MSLGIRSKLSLAFLFATAVTVIGMLLFVQWSFDEGFLKYVNTQNLQRLQALEDDVVEIYAESGDWQVFHRNPELWHTLMQRSRREFSVSQAAPPTYSRFSHDQQGGPGQPPPGFRPPPGGFPPGRGGFDGGGRPPFPPPFAGDWRTEPRERVIGGRSRFDPQRQRPLAGSPPDQFSQPAPPPRPEGSPEGQVMLFDADKNVVIGPRIEDEKVLFHALMMNDKLVGHLGMISPSHVTGQLDLSFVEEQTETYALIALIMLLVSLILVFPLAYQLVKPIRTLADGARRLTSGKFDTRIPVNTKDELGQLSHDFNVLAETLEANELARKTWVADVSHELRTPLSVLKGQIEAIQDGIREANPETLMLLHGKVKDLSGLIDDLYELSLSDLGALSYRKEQLGVEILIEDAMEAFSHTVAESGLSLQTDFDLPSGMLVFVDEKRVNQLIANLLKNSTKYTDRGGIIRVTTFTEKEPGKRNSRLCFVVEDSAPGINDQDLPKLFDRLFRVEASRNRASGGAGLGLSICKNIVEAHSGTINAAHSELGGLKVTVKLPLN